MIVSSQASRRQKSQFEFSKHMRGIHGNNMVGVKSGNSVRILGTPIPAGYVGMPTSPLNSPSHSFTKIDTQVRFHAMIGSKMPLYFCKFSRFARM